MKRDGNLLRISWLIEIAGISRNAYYTWARNTEVRSKREEKDRADFDLILEAYKYRNYKKGARSIYMRLLHGGTTMNIKKIRRLMRKYGLVCPIRKPNPYRAMLRAEHENKVVPNVLNRNFRTHGPRKVLLTDITYLYYGNSQRCYLSTVKDAYTNECLAHVLSRNLKEEFVLQTFRNVHEEHGDELSATTMVHSDQGAHYTAVRFSKLLADMNLIRSMSRRANCWDNAPQESFFGHMKDEIGDNIRRCKTLAQVEKVVNEWVDYYNNERYQWNLAKMAPAQYYQYCLTGDYPQ